MEKLAAVNVIVTWKLNLTFAITFRDKKNKIGIKKQNLLSRRRRNSSFNLFHS